MTNIKRQPLGNHKKYTNLEILSVERAWHNLSQNKYGRWPVREKIKSNKNRIEPFPDIYIDIPTIKREDQVMTLGSCFANNLLRYLSFFNVNSINQNHFSSCGREDIQWTNIYNPLVFLEFIQMAKEIYSTGELSERSKNLGLVQVEHGYVDLMFTIERTPDIREKSVLQQKRYRFLKNFIAKIFEADVLILTLGLVECWYDKLHQGHTNISVRVGHLENEKDRFEFHVLEYNQIVMALNEMINVITTTGEATPKIIFTVSPVPLMATFRRQDVIVANCYSKSLLRACVEHVVVNHEDVYYFPSYEMVTQSGLDIWTNDLRHIKPHIIVRIVNRFVHHALHRDHFPMKTFTSLVLYTVIQLLSKTEDLPTNNKREVCVGLYSVYPDRLEESMLLNLKQTITQENDNIVRTTKSYLFASLIVAMEEKNTVKANKYYEQLIREYKFEQTFEISLLAGYGLLLNKPEKVLNVLQPFLKKVHENWIVYYHLSLAYVQMKKFAKAIYEVNTGLKNKGLLQWVFVDHRAKKFLEYMCRIAQKQKDSKSLELYEYLIETAEWSKTD